MKEKIVVRGERKQGNAPLARKTPRWIWAIPPLFGGLLYAATLANGFVLDDEIVILKDPRMGSLENFFVLRGGELVVRYWSLLLDSVVWGMNPAGYHFTNLILFAATALALFCYLRKLLATLGPASAVFGLGRNEATALGASLLFAAHPMLTEAVAGATHRKEVLATLFLILALWRSLDAERAWRRSLEVACYLALAMFSKAPAIVFFPLLLAQDLWIRKRPLREWLPKDARFCILPLVAAAGYLAFRWAGISEAVTEDVPRHFTAYNPQTRRLSQELRLLTSIKTLGNYWGLLLVPLKPTLERYVEPARSAMDPVPWAMILTGFLMLASGVVIRKSRPLLALGLAWLVVTPLPTINLIPLNFLFAERYLFLPAVGLAIVLADLLAWAARSGRGAQKAVAAGVIALLCLFSPIVVIRCMQWKDVPTLLAATVRGNPDSPRIAFFHAQDLRDQGRIKESLDEVLRGLAVVEASPESWHLAGRNYVDLGKPDEALDAFARAVKLSRRAQPGWINDYAVQLIERRKYAQAESLLAQAIEKRPRSQEFRDNYIQLLLLRKETRARGMQILEAETKTYPERTTPWLLLVETRVAEGNLTGAESAAREARSHLPDPAVHRYLEARLAEARGDLAAAHRGYAALLSDPATGASLQKRARTSLQRIERTASSP